MIYISRCTTGPGAAGTATGRSTPGAPHQAAAAAATRAARRAAAMLLGAAWLASTASSPAAAAGARPPAADDVRLVTGDRFCIDAQAQVAATRVPTVNVVHTDYQAFVESKPKPRPLETEQYVWFEDDARTQPKMVSCKMKTSDHIRFEYGEDQSGGDTSCAALNQRTAEVVLASLTRDERRQLKFDGGRKLVFDPDLVIGDGPMWLAPFAVLYVGEDSALHVKSKGMKNDWFDPRLANAAPRVKGTRYCHLVAPEYLRRVLLGQVQP